MSLNAIPTYRIKFQTNFTIWNRYANEWPMHDHVYILKFIQRTNLTFCTSVLKLIKLNIAWNSVVNAMR